MTKKSNGVYYTPSYVVDYIVRDAIGPLVEGKSPMQLAGCYESWERDHAASPLTVLDPACGTGNFLLGAYQFLLDWCLRWYEEHDRERWTRGLHATLCRVGNSLGLGERERRRILRTHIFGVDIDEQAIAVAQRSLLAKSVGDRRVHERQSVASSLANIRCGNSLIGSDFDKSPTLPSSDATPIVRTFDWEGEFPAVFAAGGFDAIVGNPPYVNARLMKQEQGESVKRYYRAKYRCARRAFDLYVLFVERSQELLRDGGRAGLIVPNKIATLDYARACRELLLRETTIEAIIDVSDQQPFPDASVYPYIITWKKKLPVPGHHVRVLRAAESAGQLLPGPASLVRQASWSAETGLAVHQAQFVELRVATRPLHQCGSIHSGTTGFSAERLAQALQDGAAASDAFPFIVSGNVDRYSITLGSVRFMKRVFARPVLQRDSEVLTEHKRKLFSGRKIVVAGMSRRLEAALDSGGLALGVQVYAISDFKDDPRFLLGVLNSKLMSFIMRTRFHAKRLAGGYLSINKGQLAQLPIRIVDEQDRRSVRLRERVIELVDTLKHVDAQSDREIDRLIYQLYALTDDEVDAVERCLACATRLTASRRRARRRESDVTQT